MTSYEVASRDLANAIRSLSIDAIEAANSGHPGMPLGAADIATVLFTQILKYDAAAPAWADRDRFVLSSGHASMLLYSVLHLAGYQDVALDEIRRFRQFGSKTPGHPEYGHTSGVETTTGPLGQGLANAVGMAIAECRMRSEFGPDLVDHRTYALVGDGCLMEGLSQEAIALAGHLGLSRLIVIWDDNRITIDGNVALADSTDQHARFQACGWNTIAVDGHDPATLAAALEHARASDKPTLIAARTIIGYGAPSKAGTPSAHGAPLGPDEAAAAKTALGIGGNAFEVPEEIISAWRAAGQRGRTQRLEWERRLASHPRKQDFKKRLTRDIAEDLDAALRQRRSEIAEARPELPGRKLSQDTLEVFNGLIPNLFGGSADLTPANQTASSQSTVFDANTPSGRYLHYGIREHAMAAVMNGIALHGGLIPYGGTFLVFTDYARPAIRLAALMKIGIIYVMTHDSIALGPDGPTHQPIEHLASLRLIPNLLVMRPADAVEVAECWSLAIASSDAPSILALSRQPLEMLRDPKDKENRSAKGAYTIYGEADATAVIFASGSEVAIAVEAARMLASDGIAARVVSAPCLELLDRQTDAYKKDVIGTEPARVAVEAGLAASWLPLLGSGGRFVGMTGFGESGPAEDIYAHFGITPSAIVEAVKLQL